LFEKRDTAGNRTQIRCLIADYPDSERARDALDHFHRVYLPEHPLPPESSPSVERRGVYEIEDGWSGVRLKEKTLVLVFECPDRETARTVIVQIR
jgi:hypothetical protein